MQGENPPVPAAGLALLCRPHHTAALRQNGGIMPKKYYAVRSGRQTGIFLTWEECRKQVPVVETGEFGADMKVSLLNDGPFTIILDEKIL